VVYSAKNDPAKMGQAKLAAMSRFARGQKKGLRNLFLPTGKSARILFVSDLFWREPRANPQAKKGCHGQIPGKKEEFLTTTHVQFYSAAAIRCHPHPATLCCQTTSFCRSP
jgi:hypothetical protein